MTDEGEQRQSAVTTLRAESIELASVRRWLKQVVVGLGLCPFAAPFLSTGKVRLVQTPAVSEQALLEDLYDELQLLDASEPAQIETTLLVAPDMLNVFADYNQFLDFADALIVDSNWEGCFQIASFHPHYCFAGNDPDDPANLTNRSPYPLLHLLRESSIARVLTHYPDPEQIPVVNAATLRSMDCHLRAALFPYLR